MPQQFEDTIVQAVDIRLYEVDKLRLHILGVSDSEVLYFLASLLIVRLYAFLESGVKDIVNSYISGHESAVKNVSELHPSYIVWRYSETIRGYIANIPAGTKLLSVDDEVVAFLSREVDLRPIKVQLEYRTMNYEALSEIYIGCDLDTAVIDSHSTEINQLCGRRHDVAHGRLMESTSSGAVVAKADAFRTLLVEILYDLALQCVEGLSRRALKVK